MSQRQTKQINILSELDRLEIKWIPYGDDEIKVPCPAHDDKTPSASLNTKEHVWKCYTSSCGEGGDFISFLAFAHKTTRAVILADLQTRYPGLAGISTIPSQTIEKFVANLDKAGPLLKELDARGITREIRAIGRLGFHDGRITIPVFDESGRCVNVRRYLPGAPGPQKMRNTVGHGKPNRLYQVDTITSETAGILICGGELKALLAGQCIKDIKMAAVSSTGGEGHWMKEWTHHVRGRRVYVMMDVDEAGEIASKRLAIQLAAAAKSVHVVRLPLDKDKYPKGDVNDWFGQEGATKEDLVKLLKETPEWLPKSLQKQQDSEEPAPEKIQLDQAFHSAKNVGKRIAVDAVIAAADQTPFYVPKTCKVECSRDQPNCHQCPVHLLEEDADGQVEMMIPPGSPALLGMVNAARTTQRIYLQEALSIPPCKSVQFHEQSSYIVHDVRLAPPIDLSGGRVTDNWFPCMIVSDGSTLLVELNVPCEMIGYLYPHPATQQATALVTHCKELEDTLLRFNCTEDDAYSLRSAFCPTTPEQTEETINRIYADLEANVTWIFERRDMHIALDLAWHCPLLLNFGGRQINGWMNLLVIGDSAQGKSEATTRMLHHYGCGDRLDCKNATVAGLLGGLEQLGNRWFVRWGAIPTRDRMLVILEELKGANVEVLAKLTDMRSSGIAEIPKIERRRAMARTRIIAISNPRSPRPLDSFHFGVQAIHELIGNLEDVRRFDLAIAVARGEVSDEIINMMPSSRPKVVHRATSALSRKLILWAWTRKPDQVILSREVTDAIVQASIVLSKKFDERIPLVDQGTIRHKIARMSAALAARLFSSPDGNLLVVGEHHVRFIHAFIDRVYSSKAMGYDQFSAAERAMSRMREPKIVEKAIRNTKHPADFCDVLLSLDVISMDDITSALGTDIDVSRDMLSLLVRKGALLRVSRSGYAKNAEFIQLLRSIRSSGYEHDTDGDEF